MRRRLPADDSGMAAIGDIEADREVSCAGQVPCKRSCPCDWFSDTDSWTTAADDRTPGTVAAARTIFRFKRRCTVCKFCFSFLEYAARKMRVGRERAIQHAKCCNDETRKLRKILLQKKAMQQRGGGCPHGDPEGRKRQFTAIVRPGRTGRHGK